MQSYSPGVDIEAALIVVSPAADAVVGDQRSHLDRAARAGVPAHLTVVYPFKADLDDEDHRALVKLFGSFPAFRLRGERTGWFEESVVFIEPVDPTPVIALTEAVHAAFPAFPIYGGRFDEIVPHLTIGHDQPYEALRAAERVVQDRLPISQVVNHVELWSGPALATAPDGSWRRLRTYRLGNTD